MNVGLKTMSGALAAISILLIGGCSRQAQAPSETTAMPATVSGALTHDVPAQDAPAQTLASAPLLAPSSTAKTKVGGKSKASARPVKAERIAWEPSVDKAMAKFKAQPRILMIDFGATWCSACKILDQVVYPDPEVVAAARPFINVRVDVDKYPQIAADFNATKLPTIVLISPKGTILQRIEGARAPEVMAALMREAVTREMLNVAG